MEVSAKRVYKIGDGGCFILVPKKFIDRMGVKVGDQVLVCFDGNEIKIRRLPEL